MIKHGYIIKAQVKTAKGNTERTLTKHFEFALATNMAFRADSPEKAAKQWEFINEQYRSVFMHLLPDKVTHAWIEGMRGGVYTIETGKYVR